MTFRSPLPRARGSFHQSTVSKQSLVFSISFLIKMDQARGPLITTQPLEFDSVVRSASINFVCVTLQWSAFNTFLLDSEECHFLKSARLTTCSLFFQDHGLRTRIFCQKTPGPSATIWSSFHPSMDGPGIVTHIKVACTRSMTSRRTRSQTDRSFRLCVMIVKMVTPKGRFRSQQKQEGPFD